MKKVLFYPGTFNPPHLGHVSLIIAALKTVSVDEVWIMPSGIRINKHVDTSCEDRKRLAEIFVSYLQTKVSLPVRLISTAVDNVDGKYTHEHIIELKANATEDTFQLVGIDGYLGITERVVSPDERYVIHMRPGYNFPDSLLSNKNLIIIDEVSGISSTEVREKVKNGDVSYKELVPDEVAQYIEENGLYR